jgi:hypothetical protein
LFGRFVAIFSFLILQEVPKKVLELQKFATLLDTKGDKILQTIKICKIFMLSPCKWVVTEYKTFIAKMSKDQIENEAPRSNLEK